MHVVEDLERINGFKITSFIQLLIWELKVCLSQ